MSRDDKRFNASIAKAFLVLEAIRAARRPVSLAHLVSSTQVEKSAVHRILYTLKELGYVNQDAATNLFLLSQRTLEFGQRSVVSDRLISTAEPILAALNRETEHSVSLVVPEGRRVTYVVRMPSRKGTEIGLPVGTQLSLVGTASGRMILATRPRSEVVSLLQSESLEALTPFTNSDPDIIMEIIDQARLDGYCISDQETFVKHITAAVPVLGKDGQALAAVTITGLAPVWDAQLVKSKLVPMIVGASSDISKVLLG